MSSQYLTNKEILILNICILITENILVIHLILLDSSLDDYLFKITRINLSTNLFSFFYGPL